MMRIASRSLRALLAVCIGLPLSLYLLMLGVLMSAVWMMTRP